DCEEREDYQGGAGYPIIHLPLGSPQAEVWPEAIPQPKTHGYGDRAEQPEDPRHRTLPEHFSAVPRAEKRADADVSAVRDQTETGKNPRVERPRLCPPREHAPEYDRQDHPNQRPCPDNDQGMGVFDQIGARDRERLEDDLGNLTASEYGA